MKRLISISIFLIFTMSSIALGAIDLKALAARKELWPKEITLIQTIHFSKKKILIGSKFPLLNVSSDEILFEADKERYRLDPKFTNLSLLVDENSLIQNPTANSPQTTTLLPSQMGGPDFSFLLDIKREFSESDRTKAIDLLLTEGGYLKASAQLREALFKYYDSGETISPEWTHRLYFASICELLGQKESSLTREGALFSNKGDSSLYKRFKPETLRYFLSSPHALTKALLVLKSEDDPIGLLTILETLLQAYPEQMNDYSSLAGAFAIVYDQAIPKRWPHDQVNHKLVPLLKDQPWLPLFEYFFKKDQENQLAGKIKEMSVSELKYVVDCPIEISELEWALKFQRNSRSSFDKTYFDVEYDESRISGRVAEYVWPHESPYTLANIKKNKGICIDQSYFSAIAAKAFAIPSISISGQGSNCAHAWLGFMPSGDKWNMKGGRYAANNYVVGFALDPQTWNLINDHELEYISQRYSDSKEYEQSQEFLIFEALCEQFYTKEQRAKILTEAKSLCLKNPEPWFKLEKLYKANSQKEELKSLYTEMIQQISAQKDWKIRAQEGLGKINSDPVEGSTNPSETSSQIMNENRSKRSDLAIQTAARDSLQKLQNENYEEAYTLYQTIIKRFGKENGLMILSDLVQPFVAISLSKEQVELTNNSLKFAEKLVDNTQRQASLNQTKQYLDYLKKEVAESLLVK